MRRLFLRDFSGQKADPKLYLRVCYNGEKKYGVMPSPAKGKRHLNGVAFKTIGG